MSDLYTLELVTLKIGEPTDADIVSILNVRPDTGTVRALVAVPFDLSEEE